MKLKLASVVLAGAVLGGQAWGYTVSGTDVGGLDDLLDDWDKDTFTTECGPGSGEEAETCMVNEALADLGLGSTTFSVKTENAGAVAVDGETNILAFDLQGTPGYFLIKNSTFYALYENNPDLGWAVFDIALLPDGFNASPDEWTISHITEFGSETEVPVPGTLGLLGLGLVALGAMRRRQTA